MLAVAEAPRYFAGPLLLLRFVVVNWPAALTTGGCSSTGAARHFDKIRFLFIDERRAVLRAKAHYFIVEFCIAGRAIFHTGRTADTISA